MATHVTTTRLGGVHTSCPPLTTSSSLPPPPLTIEQYADHAMLHEGRHSTVWSAREPSSGGTVVIKSYCKTRMKPRHAKHVVRETRLLQLFRDTRCRGVVRLHHAYEDEDCVHLVFEPCMRGDLYQLMTKQQGKLQEQFVACQVIAPLLSTLSFLHKLNIVHRDVKTENIFLSSSGELQLGDFGLVAHKVHDNLVDRVGTLDYMAPEVLSMPLVDNEGAGSGEQTPYDEKVDIWAVGVLLYELLVGRPPFEVEDPGETARLILIAKVTNFPSTLPQDCIDFIHSALTRDPADRPSAVQLLRHAWLERHLKAAAQPAPHYAHVAAAAAPPPPQQHSDLDIAAIGQLIDDAWKIDELERVMSQLSLSRPMEVPSGPGPAYSASLPELPEHSSCFLSHNPAGLDQDCTLGGADEDSLVESPGSVLITRPTCTHIHSPKTAGPSSCGDSPIQSPSSPGAWARQAREATTCALRSSSYQVLGKDLAHMAAMCATSVGGPGGAPSMLTQSSWSAPGCDRDSAVGSPESVTCSQSSYTCLTGGPGGAADRDTFWEGAGRLGVESSSRSFTSGTTSGCMDGGASRSADASRAATPAWQRAAPQKASAGRSRFAS